MALPIQDESFEEPKKIPIKSEMQQAIICLKKCYLQLLQPHSLTLQLVVGHHFKKSLYLLESCKIRKKSRVKSKFKERIVRSLKNFNFCCYDHAMFIQQG